jgi:hypothetical protein
MSTRGVTRSPDGAILGVGIDVGKEAYLDLEKLAVAAFARD